MREIKRKRGSEKGRVRGREGVTERDKERERERERVRKEEEERE